MLSVIILTKNSEDTVADCIGSVKELTNKIVVIDSESTDRTQEIAKHLKAEVIVHPFKDFASQRNYAMNNVKNKWILFLDSDECATPEFIAEIKTILENHQDSSDVNGYYIYRKTYFFNKDWGLIDQVQRLFLTEKFIEWVGVIHETPKIHGKFGVIESPIIHKTHRNLSQMIEKTNEWSEYEAELRLKARHPKMSIWRFIRIMVTAFLQSYLKEKGYKNGTVGFIESTYQAFSFFITYAKLWEKQNSKKTVN